MPRKCLILQNRTSTQAKTGLSCPFLVNRTSNAANVRCGCPFLQNRTTGVLKVCCGCPFLQNQTSEARFVSDSWAYLTYMADLLMRHEPFRLYMAVSLRKYAQNVPPKWCFAVSNAIYKRESSGQPRESAIYRRDRAAGGMSRRKYGNKVVGWARLTTNGMRQCRKICVRAQKQSFGGRNVRFAG